MSIFLKEATNCRATANYQVFEYSLYLRKICCNLLCMRPCHSALETKTETSAEWTRVMSRPRSLVHNSQHWWMTTPDVQRHVIKASASRLRLWPIGTWSK